MTKLKRIKLSQNAAVLSDQEMKQIRGGSVYCSCPCGGGYCSGSSVSECESYGCAGQGGCGGSPICWTV